MDWTQDPLEKILEELPRHTKSYSEQKAKRMRQAEANEPDLDVLPKTLHEMEDIVNESMDYAKANLTAIEMFDHLNALYYEWLKAKNSFIVMSVLVTSLKYRNTTEIETLLKQIAGEV